MAHIDQMDTILQRIDGLRSTEKILLVCIEGCCGSGKTMLAERLRQHYRCNVIHMDDFYLPVNRRQKDWERIPGQNMDFARLRSEVIEPLSRGEPCQYVAYDCSRGDFRTAERMSPADMIVLEGSYCLHPNLGIKADLAIFVRCSQSEQLKRLKDREGERIEMFRKRWIPLENRYHRDYHVVSRCDILYETDIE